MIGVLLLKAISPITHGATTAGNEQIIRREKVATPLGNREVPVITGNSLRHRLFREPIADALTEGRQFTKEQLRWLYNGGALAGGKVINVDVRRQLRAAELLPHVEAIGCSMPDTIVAGKLDMSVAWLACSETIRILKAMLPTDWISGDEWLLPSHEFLSRNQYYRHDAAKFRVDRLEEDSQDGDDYKGMPHGGEHVIPGAVFVCTFHADQLSDLAASALMFAIEQWAASGATIGGQSSKGHGQVEPHLWTDREVTSEPYREHVAAREAEILEFVGSLYAKPEKSK